MYIFKYHFKIDRFYPTEEQLRAAMKGHAQELRTAMKVREEKATRLEAELRQTRRAAAEEEAAFEAEQERLGAELARQPKKESY